MAALCVPTAFDGRPGSSRARIAVVRDAQIWLFILASREDPGLRHSVLGLAISTTIGCGLIGRLRSPTARCRAALWALALLLDMGGPLFIDTEGWRLVPNHFAERHGLIVLIALGESVVAIGAGAQRRRRRRHVAAAAVVGIAVVSALWWLYFDVVALVAARRLVNARRGRRAQRASPATRSPTCTCR